MFVSPSAEEWDTLWSKCTECVLMTKMIPTDYFMGDVLVLTFKSIFKSYVDQRNIL